jgi:fermentation-respiration switch protein FrsA (DUF1100 family)
VGAAILVAGYGALLGWLVLDESALVFHPEAGTPAPAPPGLGLDARDVTFVGGDATPLAARIVPPPPENGRAGRAPWILYFHGSSGNVGTPGYDRAWARFRQLGFGVFAVDYRGYGASGGRPSEAGLYRDADSAYAYLTGTLHVAPPSIVIYGYSLGSAVAIDLAGRVPAAGLVVEGAFTSIPDRGAELYPYVPVRWLARIRFASIDKIARVSSPKLFIHGEGDTIVPIAHGRRLFAAALPPKEFKMVVGGHTDAFERDPEFFATIAAFTRELGLIPPVPPPR